MKHFFVLFIAYAIFFLSQMSPATRSSAPSTPAKPRVSTGSDSITPTRRTPHCTKCHRPRAGHPRSGCPYVDASDASPVSPSASKAVQIASAADGGLSEELSSLHIVSPTEENARRRMPLTKNGLKRKLSVRFALVPEQTLASLSPTDTHLVGQLLQPGMMTDAVMPEDRVAHVLKWRQTLDDPDPSNGAKGEEQVAEEAEPANMKAEPASHPKLSRCMPCTLSTPTASLTVTEPVSDQHIGGSDINVNETIYLLPDAKTPKPLDRSMSFEQRSLFLQQLSSCSSTPPATLLSIPHADLKSVESDAAEIGFIVHVLPSQDDAIKWVVLGTDEEAIKFLSEKFLEEEKRSTKAKGNGGKFKAIAGGVVFGAVATWSGLAFS